MIMGLKKGKEWWKETVKRKKDEKKVDLMNE